MADDKLYSTGSSSSSKPSPTAQEVSGKSPIPPLYGIHVVINIVDLFLSSHRINTSLDGPQHLVKIRARATIDLLKDTFDDRLISRFGPVNWPPRSCDLTPLDYVLWGYVKSLAYADKPQTLDHFEDNIRRVIADIRPQMLEKVIENRTSRLDYIRASRGSHMPEIIFKM
ncbi:DUF4817 domain-containing protein [Trichonephila clavipes]|nr:DUF4817 domain-containing protein [Trichonephila clavipes]